MINKECSAAEGQVFKGITFYEKQREADDDESQCKKKVQEEREGKEEKDILFHP